jgi:hypothetical protein
VKNPWAEIDQLREQWRQPAPDCDTPEGEVSPDVARRLRNESRIARGIHPFGQRLREPAGETCGSCKFKFAHWSNPEKKFFKCEKVKQTRGPGSDIRLKWPACVLWEAA